MSAEPGEALHAEVGTLLAATGPRPSCSPAERALGSALEARWSGFCDEVRAEPFRCAPHAFLGSVPLVAAAALVAAALLPRWPGLAAALAAIAVVVLVVQLVRVRELLDPLFPQATGVNVVGVIRPTGEVRQRVILSAHQDSAWEFNVWWWFGRAGPVVNAVGLGAPLVTVVTGALLAAGVDASAGVTLAWVLAPLVAVHLPFHTFRPVPGAMDDLAGIVTISAAGRALAGARLDHTEVVLLACAAEECGLRGAKRYAAAHRAAHAAVPTIDVNVDGVYDERHLSVVTWEVSTGVRHDPALTALAGDVAGALGLPIRRVAIPLGVTDATAFAQAGVRTVALLAQDTRTLVPNYHTRLDTLDRVRPEALAAVRDVVVGVVRAVDGQGRHSP